MTPLKLSLIMRLLGTPLVLLSIASCGDYSGPVMAQTAMPPTFNANESQQTDSNMSQLGYQLALLDRELLEDEYNQIDQDIVVSILRQMEMISSSFMAEDAGESHAFLQEDMATFIASIIDARVAAAARPPRYYLAGKVAGGCVNCHSVSW